MKVLVACEESQTVCKAFRDRKIEAYSADVQACSGGKPEWHILGDVLPIINGKCKFRTMDGAEHCVDGKWDLLIAHPPCTYLSAVGATSLFNGDGAVKDHEREKKGWQARHFFLQFLNADCDHIAIENPAPLKYFNLPPYSQIIEPYQYGEPWKKRTCLWLKNLPELVPTHIVKPLGCWVDEGNGGRTNRTKLRTIRGKRTGKERSKTFQGIAEAMADQWGVQLHGIVTGWAQRGEVCGQISFFDDIYG